MAGMKAKPKPKAKTKGVQKGKAVASRKRKREKTKDEVEGMADDEREEEQDPQQKKRKNYISPKRVQNGRPSSSSKAVPESSIVNAGIDEKKTDGQPQQVENQNRMNGIFPFYICSLKSFRCEKVEVSSNK